MVTAAVRSTAGTTSTPVAQIVTAAESLPSDARGFAANAAYDANPTSTNDNDAAVTIPATASIAMTTLSGSVTTVTSPVAATEKNPQISLYEYVCATVMQTAGRKFALYLLLYVLSHSATVKTSTASAAVSMETQSGDSTTRQSRSSRPITSHFGNVRRILVRGSMPPCRLKRRKF